MRALIVSDIHGNIDAVEALCDWMRHQPPFDAIWILGDLVDYGAAPAEVIDWVRTQATIVVRGNHDHAMATGATCGSSPAFLPLSESTRLYWRSRLAPADLQYLADLPQGVELTLNGGSRLALVHACPKDPLYRYVPSASDDSIWRDAIEPARAAAFVLVGHTHDQFVRRVDATTIVNPGSLGLPLNEDARAAFAVLENGEVQLVRIPYDTKRAAGRILELNIEPDCQRRLVGLVLHARLID